MSRSDSSGGAALPVLAILEAVPLAAIETLLDRVPLYAAAAAFGFAVIALLDRKAGLPINPGLALWITSAVFLHALGTFWLYDTAFW